MHCKAAFRLLLPGDEKLALTGCGDVVTTDLFHPLRASASVGVLAAIRRCRIDGWGFTTMWHTVKHNVPYVPFSFGTFTIFCLCQFAEPVLFSLHRRSTYVIFVSLLHLHIICFLCTLLPQANHLLRFVDRIHHGEIHRHQLTRCRLRECLAHEQQDSKRRDIKTTTKLCLPHTL